VVADFPADQDLSGIDFVYPLFAMSDPNGELYVQGLSPSDLSSIHDRLGRLGFDVSSAPSDTLLGEFSHSPLVVLMIVILILAELSAAMSWSIDQRRSAVRLQRTVLLGASRGSVVLRDLPTAIVAWSITAITGSVLPAVALHYASPGQFPLILPTWSVALGLDLVLAVGLFAGHAYRLSGVIPQ